MRNILGVASAKAQKLGPELAKELNHLVVGHSTTQEPHAPPGRLEQVGGDLRAKLLPFALSAGDNHPLARLGLAGQQIMKDIGYHAVDPRRHVLHDSADLICSIEFVNLVHCRPDHAPQKLGSGYAPVLGRKNKLPCFTSLTAEEML